MHAKTGQLAWTHLINYSPGTKFILIHMGREEGSGDFIHDKSFDQDFISFQN